MNDWAPAAIVAILIAGLVSEIGHVLTFVAVVTAGTSLSARYAATLRGAAATEVERHTAIGFFVGLLISAILYIVDVLV